MDKASLKEAIEFRKAVLKKLRDNYLALEDGTIQSYTIGSRSLTRRDLGSFMDEIKRLENEIEQMTGELNGKPKRRAVGALRRDW